MADATVTPPITYAQILAAGLGYSQYIEALMAMDTRFADLTNPMGFVTMVDIGAQGSKTIRKSNVDHIGGILPSALAGETSQPDLENRTAGYYDISVGSYGFSLSETYEQQIYSLPNIAAGLNIDQLIATAPESAYRLMRYLMGQLYTSIATTVGAVGTRLSVDDMIAAQVEFNADVPTMPVSGMPVLHAHMRQLAQIRESIRTEPTFVQSGVAMALQAVDASRIMPNFAGFGFDWLVGSEVTASGGGLYAGAYDRGGVALGFGQTQRVTAPTDGSVFLANGGMGLLIQEDITARRQQMRRLDAHFKMGAALADANVFRQVAVISIDAA